jgi:hypothetical protein
MGPYVLPASRCAHGPGPIRRARDGNGGAGPAGRSALSWGEPERDGAMLSDAKVTGLILGFFCALGLGGPAVAQQALIDQIVWGGTHDGERERHTVSVDDCVLTTYRWKKFDDGSEVLWSSFVVDVRGITFGHDDENGRDFYGPGEAGTLTLILFNVQEPFEARHEKSRMRKLRPDHTPSPRNGGETHAYEYKQQFMIMHVGAGVVEKAESFTEGLLRYKREHCQILG